LGSSVYTRGVARDFYHIAVKNALEKQGWRVTHDPLYFDFEDFSIMLDLAAERIIAFERDQERIAVEVKGFGRTSKINEYHSALGQYRNYQAALELRDPNRKIYLAIPSELYDTFFQNALVQYTLKRNEVALIVYNPENEVILQWLLPPT
jgi:hypothetical protein